jgi:hypothetical protein
MPSQSITPFAAAVLLACTTGLSPYASARTPADPREAIAAYWDAAKLSDWQTTWSTEHAAVAGTDDPYHYYQRMKAQWPVMSFELGAAVVEGREAELTIDLIRGMSLGGVLIPRPESKLDRWTWMDGQWRHVETVNPPAPAAAADEARRGDAAQGDTASGSEPPQEQAADSR